MQQFSGTINGVGGAVAAPVSDDGLVTLQVLAGTFAGANLIFEASIDSSTGADGTWVNINAARSNANVAELSSGVIAAPPAYAWEISVAGYAWFRVRATALTSGSVPVQMSVTTVAQELAPVIQQHGVTAAAASFSATVTPVGSSALSFVSAATTNAAVDKASAGSLFEVSISNPTATPVFVKFYNKATAPTVGTDVPVLTIPVAAGETKPFEFGSVGKRFPLGIGHAVTGAAAATDTTAAVAGVQVHGSYI